MSEPLTPISKIDLHAHGAEILAAASRAAGTIADAAPSTDMATWSKDIWHQFIWAALVAGIVTGERLHKEQMDEMMRDVMAGDSIPWQ